MSEKRFKITTSKKIFESDNASPDYLKEDNGVFYAKEHKSDDWQQIKKFEERTSTLDKWHKCSWIFAVVGYIGTFILLGVLVGNNKSHTTGNTIASILMVVWIYVGIWIVMLIGGLIDKVLKQYPSYYEQITNKEIKKIIESNKWRSGTTSSNSYRNYSSKSSYSGGGYSNGGSGGGSGSYSGGGSVGSYSGYSKDYISSSDLDKALKDIESKGKDWDKLANFTTDEEREKLFASYFKNEGKGKIANEKFNREQLWPARKRTLNKMLEEAEYEDDEIKENLRERINEFNDEISNGEFQTVAKEIKKFQERKKLKDNHVKYEGRLNNKDIQSIKEYHGYICMGCGLDPVKEYGSEMKGILEAHHKRPWSEIEANEVRTVEPDDFYILCPTCHRVIHRLEHPDDLEGLKEVVNKKKSSWWN